MRQSVNGEFDQRNARIPGAEGPKGDPGVTGNHGRPGIKGPRGPAPFGRGPTGPPGIPGLNGGIGPEGAKGKKGPRGKNLKSVKKVNCKWGDWSEWQPCSKTCGDGVQKRERSHLERPQGGGKSCEGSYFQTVPCGVSCFKLALAETIRQLGGTVWDIENIDDTAPCTLFIKGNWTGIKNWNEPQPNGETYDNNGNLHSPNFFGYGYVSADKCSVVKLEGTDQNHSLA